MRRSLIAALLASVIASPALAQGDAWPNRPITLMGGFPNGAGTDIYARRLAEPLSRALGQPVVVDSRTGAGGNIGSDFVAKSRPDGYTFYFGTAGTHAINAALYKNLPFDVQRDFTPVVLLGDVPNVMIVSPEKRPQFQNCAQVLAAARARQEVRQARPASPAVSAQSAPPPPESARPAPVHGRISVAFGQRGEAGPARGVSFAASPGARVVSPCAGRAVFAGPFRRFGQIVILECGPGLHLVLAGFEQLDTEAGAALLAGEALGRLGAGPDGRAALYVELRRNGQVVDPMPWLGGSE